MKNYLLLALMLFSPLAGAQVKVESLQLPATAFPGEKFPVDIYLPANYDKSRHYPVLYMHDGQDAKEVQVEATLNALSNLQLSEPMIVVGIHMLPDRMGIYGLCDRGSRRNLVANTKYGPVGKRACDYSEWVSRELVPFVDAHYATRKDAEGRMSLGWSLGAVAAFNLGWQYPELFHKIGMFSPSLWLGTDSRTPLKAQQTRWIQNLVQQRAQVPKNLRIYIAIGDQEDQDDRDGDGVNDALDDVQDWVNGWQGRRGLKQRRIPYVLRVYAGEKHNQTAWRHMLPRFLVWAGDGK